MSTNQGNNKTHRGFCMYSLNSVLSKYVWWEIQHGINLQSFKQYILVECKGITLKIKTVGRL